MSAFWLSTQSQVGAVSYPFQGRRPRSHRRLGEGTRSEASNQNQHLRINGIKGTLHTPYRRLAQGAATSRLEANPRSVPSPPKRPPNCTPMGNP
jgi:hypothetical protein